MRSCGAAVQTFREYPEGLVHLLSELGLPDGHPALDFVDFESVEDAAQGGIEGVAELRRRRKARGVSREELSRARQSAERIGRMGEELLNAWLESERLSGHVPNFRWESDSNAIAPYDFSVLDGETAQRRIDAKATAGEFSNPIHVSMAELDEMASGAVPYDLYRLYAVTENSARLRIARGVAPVARQLLEVLAKLPRHTTVDSISIRPEQLDIWEGEVTIDLAASQEDVNAEDEQQET